MFSDIVLLWGYFPIDAMLQADDCSVCFLCSYLPGLVLWGVHGFYELEYKVIVPRSIYNTYKF
jgi:hypothetical protein